MFRVAVKFNALLKKSNATVRGTVFDDVSDDLLYSPGWIFLFK
jgi:hypothetical protein